MSKCFLAKLIAYYKSLPQARGTCRIFEQDEDYFICGDDAILINQQVLRTSNLKVAQADGETLKYLNLNISNFVIALKYLLFVRHYKIQILENVGTVRLPRWSVSRKASPGNLTAIEDLIFDENTPYVQESRGIMGINISAEGSKLVVGVAFCDSVLREIQLCEFTDNSELTKLQSVLVQLSPQECLLPLASSSSKQVSPRAVLDKIIQTHDIALTECMPGDFSTADIVPKLIRLQNLDKGMDFMTKDEAYMKHALPAVAAIIRYLELIKDETNFGQFYISKFKTELYAKVDIQSVTDLGLFPENPTDLFEKHYLMGHVNNCCTPLGERLLVQWIKQPLMDIRKLRERHDVVEIFVNDSVLRDETSKIISRFPDLEIICRKIQRRKATLQDLYKIYVMLKQIPELHKALSKYDGNLKGVLKSSFIADFEERFFECSTFLSILESILDFDVLKNGEFLVNAEYNEELLGKKQSMDTIQFKLNKAFCDAKKDLEAPDLKMKCCNVIGHHFLLPKEKGKILKSRRKRYSYIIHRTKTSEIYFQSPDQRFLSILYFSLKELYETQQEGSIDQIINLAVPFLQPLKLLSHTVAWLDVSLSFAFVSVNAPKPYVRPNLKEKGDSCIMLKQARHPVLECMVENFVPNDVEITKDKHTFYFVMGPSMGGKSTYIRSVALNVLLAQIGCFLPCDYAEISITDAFFTCFGAYNKSSNAVSTYMFEMTEIQNILKTATSSSLLIIDDICHRTSTYNGFGMSWSISRHIAENMKSPCLFATHFDELTQLSEEVPSVCNLHLDAKISGSNIIFLYNVKPDVCNQGFGIHVAKMAGFPDIVIKEASDKLQQLDGALVSINEMQGSLKDVSDGQVPAKSIIAQNATNVASNSKRPIAVTSTSKHSMALNSTSRHSMAVASTSKQPVAVASTSKQTVENVAFDFVPAKRKKSNIVAPTKKMMTSHSIVPAKSIIAQNATNVVSTSKQPIAAASTSKHSMAVYSTSRHSMAVASTSKQTVAVASTSKQTAENVAFDFVPAKRKKSNIVAPTKKMMTSHSINAAADDDDDAIAAAEVTVPSKKSKTDDINTKTILELFCKSGENNQENGEKLELLVKALDDLVTEYAL